MRSLAAIMSDMEETSRTSEDDPEVAHSRGDALLIETIRVLAQRLAPSQRGASENIIQHWREMAKWYA